MFTSLLYAPPPPRSIGIIGLAGKSGFIYCHQSVTGKILRKKELREQLSPCRFRLCLGMMGCFLSWGKVRCHNRVWKSQKLKHRGHRGTQGRTTESTAFPELAGTDTPCRKEKQNGRPPRNCLLSPAFQINRRDCLRACAIRTETENRIQQTLRLRREGHRDGAIAPRQYPAGAGIGLAVGAGVLDELELPHRNHFRSQVPQG